MLSALWSVYCAMRYAAPSSHLWSLKFDFFIIMGINRGEPARNLRPTFYLPMHANVVTAVSAEIRSRPARVCTMQVFLLRPLKCPSMLLRSMQFPMVLILCTPENPNSRVAKKQELPYSHTKFLDFQGFCKKPPEVDNR
ncbi:hypothetical protein K449DRAFT_439431 [Hypoxylon sp. EC38]|nr:hypothetical protein K449DRAFT_439431 [Hypoxylon sp. EC38]